MDYMRFYGQQRYWILTVFAALTAGLLTLASRSDEFKIPFFAEGLYVVGCIVTATFWMAEVSGACVWRKMAQRAANLENDLSFEIFRKMPSAPSFWFLPTTWLVTGLYAAVLVFWILMGLQQLRKS